MNYFAYFSEIEEAFVRRRGRNLLLSPLDWALIESWKARGVPLFVVLRAVETVFDNHAKQAESNLAARKRPIKSLLYCRDEVELRFAAWLETQVGSGANNDGAATKAQAAASGQTANHENTIAAKQDFKIANRNPGELNSAAQKYDSSAQTALSADHIARHINSLLEHFSGSNRRINGSWQSLSKRVIVRLKEAEADFRVDQDVERLETILSELDYKIDQILNKIFSPEKYVEIETQTQTQLKQFKRQMPPDVFAQTQHALLIKNLREAADLPRFSLFYL